MNSNNFVAIIKYGGNTSSISHALNRIGVRSALVEDIHDPNLKLATHLILPGVGAAPRAMRILKNTGLYSFVADSINSNMPILGICLGMQLLFNSSNEGGVRTKGFGHFNGQISRLVPSLTHKVPNVGWRKIDIQKNSKLFNGLPNPFEFYFINAFGVIFDGQDFVTSITKHRDEVCASVESNKILGVQFHPELSGEHGLQLLSNFISEV
jgi:glutamine amidotransferase